MSGRARLPEGRRLREEVRRLARNVVSRYVLIAINLAIGLFMVRYNVQHLGPETYGLWMLVATVTTYFGALDFGYGSAVVRYVAEYRARNDVRALNEVLSTMACVFMGLGVLCYAAVVVVAAVLPDVFSLSAGQEHAGRVVLLLLGLQVALVFPFTVYGGVTSGFERYDLNNVTGIAFNVLTAAVNVVVLHLGYGLLELVTATTVSRILPFWVYRRNAYKVFPALQLRRAYFRRDRLRELTGFSVYAAVLTWSSRLLYTTGIVYVGIFLNTAAVFVYSVAQRIADTLVTATEQLHTVMLPAVVHRAVGDDRVSQRSLLVKATRLQLAVAMGLCGAIVALADVLIDAWLGPEAAGSALLTRMLAVVVALRAAIAMPSTVLQGTGYHRYIAAAASCGAAVNLVLGVPLAMGYGTAGVAAGTLAAATLTWFIIVPKACRVVDLDLSSAARQVLLPAVWPAVVAVAALAAVRQAIPGGMLPALSAAAFGVAIYVVLFLAFGLDRDERQLVRSALQSVPPWRAGRARPATQSVSLDV